MRMSYSIIKHHGGLFLRPILHLDHEILETSQVVLKCTCQFQKVLWNSNRTCELTMRIVDVLVCKELMSE